MARPVAHDLGYSPCRPHRVSTTALYRVCSHQVQTSTTRAKRLRILPPVHTNFGMTSLINRFKNAPPTLWLGLYSPLPPATAANCTDASQCLAKLCNTVEYVVELAKRVDHNDLWTSKVSPNLHPAHSLAGYAEPMADTTGTQPTVFQFLAAARRKGRANSSTSEAVGVLSKRVLVTFVGYQQQRLPITLQWPKDIFEEFSIDGSMVNVEFSQAGVGEHTVLRQRQWALRGQPSLSFFLPAPRQSRAP